MFIPKLLDVLLRYISHLHKQKKINTFKKIYLKIAKRGSYILAGITKLFRPRFKKILVFPKFEKYKTWVKHNRKSMLQLQWLKNQVLCLKISL